MSASAELVSEIKILTNIDLNLQSNHKHLFLQSEDKLYVNLGSDKTQDEEASSNILIANKQWRVIPIRYAYLGSNWPIRVSMVLYLEQHAHWCCRNMSKKNIRLPSINYNMYCTGCTAC